MGSRLARGDSTTVERSSCHANRIVLTTDGVIPSDRFEWWHDEFGSVHRVEVDHDMRPAFAASGEHWLLDSTLIGRYRTTARRVVRSPAHIRRDDFDHWVIRVMIRGVLVSRGSRGDFRAFPGQVAVTSFAQDYIDDYSAGEWVAAMIPRSALSTLGVTSAISAPSLLSGAKAGLLADYLRSLVQRLHDAGPPELPAMAEMTRTMIVQGIGDAASVSRAPVDRAVVIRKRVDRLIRDNIASARLDPKSICALAGISRSALYRLFEDQGGVAAYVQAVRLERARTELIDPRTGSSDTIAEVASRHGFYDASAFSRAFRQRFGCTPSDARGTVLRTDPAQAERSGSHRQSFCDLLR
jgi:AraC-like DNA-binding protein